MLEGLYVVFLWVRALITLPALLDLWHLHLIDVPGYLRVILYAYLVTLFSLLYLREDVIVIHVVYYTFNHINMIWLYYLTPVPRTLIKNSCVRSSYTHAIVRRAVVRRCYSSAGFIIARAF